MRGCEGNDDECRLMKRRKRKKKRKMMKNEL